MKEYSFIDFEFQGQMYRFKGRWPDAVASAVGEAKVKLSKQGKRYPGYVRLLEEAGATILKVSSVREDGSIHPADLPETIYLPPPPKTDP